MNVISCRNPQNDHRDWKLNSTYLLLNEISFIDRIIAAYFGLIIIISLWCNHNFNPTASKISIMLIISPTQFILISYIKSSDWCWSRSHMNRLLTRCKSTTPSQPHRTHIVCGGFWRFLLTSAEISLTPNVKHFVICGLQVIIILSNLLQE